MSDYIQQRQSRLLSSPESRAFNSCFSDLTEGLTHSLIDILPHLRQHSLLSNSVLTDAGSHTMQTTDKITLVMSALKSKVNTDSKAFHIFLENVLYPQHHLVYLYDKLKKEYEIYSAAELSYQAEPLMASSRGLAAQFSNDSGYIGEALSDPISRASTPVHGKPFRSISKTTELQNQCPSITELQSNEHLNQSSSITELCEATAQMNFTRLYIKPSLKFPQSTERQSLGHPSVSELSATPSPWLSPSPIPPPPQFAEASDQPSSTNSPFQFCPPSSSSCVDSSTPRPRSPNRLYLPPNRMPHNNQQTQTNPALQTNNDLQNLLSQRGQDFSDLYQMGSGQEATSHGRDSKDELLLPQLSRLKSTVSIESEDNGCPGCEDKRDTIMTLKREKIALLEELTQLENFRKDDSAFLNKKIVENMYLHQQLCSKKEEKREIEKRLREVEKKYKDLKGNYSLMFDKTREVEQLKKRLMKVEQDKAILESELRSEYENSYREIYSLRVTVIRERTEKGEMSKQLNELAARNKELEHALSLAHAGTSTS